MSLSPSSLSNSSELPAKRPRSLSGSTNGTLGNNMAHSPTSPAQAQHQLPPGHIPKRGARACTACRKGKNRCEGEVSAVDNIYRVCRPAIPPWLRSANPPGPDSPTSLQAPCRRCTLAGTPCIFEKPEKKNSQQMLNGSLECVICFLTWRRSS